MNPLLKNQAFGLIEVLIATIVLSIGLLGIATLQHKSMLLSLDNTNSATAKLLATEMANRLKANVIEAKKGTSSTYITTISPAINVAPSTTLNVNACYSTSGCSSIELAKTDLYDWWKQVQISLPNSQGLICFDNVSTMSCSSTFPNAASLIYTIKISWTNSAGSTTIIMTQAQIN